MNWARSIAALLVLSSTSAWGYTLTWTANTESDLAGYRVYYCSVSTCSETSGNASLLATLGMVTSFNIGTPATTQYYFLTAVDFSNNESAASALVTYSPPSSVPQAIGVSPASFSFGATQGGADPATQTLNITNTGGGTLSWTVSDNATWLTPSQTLGSGNAAVTLNVSSSGLAAGVHYGTITINATGASSVTVPVEFTVASAPVPVIEVSPASISFAAIQGSANPAAQTLSITNTGGGTLVWSVIDNATWLSLSPASGTGNGAATLSVSTGTMAAGTYHSTITVRGTGASSVAVPVTFTITTGSSLPPAIGVSPTNLSFTGRYGGNNPPSQTLNISNTGGGILSWTVTKSDARWLAFTSSSGTQNGTVTVSVTSRYLPPGTHTATLSIWMTGSSTPVVVPVRVRIRWPGFDRQP